MGSQLSAMAPTSIHPVEYYLADLVTTENLVFDHSLGSTRFFKVARVRLRGQQTPALAVAKVFVIHDPSLPIKKYKDKLDRLKDLLAGNTNALPFTRIILNDKAGILLRQFVRYSLYDRLSTRPFLALLEKKWIAFQLLKCFQWIHRNGLTHGDLKLENIMITSCLWVLVTDFAIFKPTFVPDDNPSDFSFFFDTSRRRTCNLAPERFTSQDDFVGVSPVESAVTATGTTGLSPSSPPVNVQMVTPQMDLFSLGCVLAELFSETSDFQLFDLASILHYKSYPKSQLEDTIIPKLESAITSEEKIRAMIINLIDADPGMRNSTTQHLMELTPSVFPNCFSLLFDYFKDLIYLSPDGKIVRLEEDLKSLLPPVVQEEPQGLLLLLTLLTSNLRSLKHVNAKISAIRLIRRVVDASVDVMSPYILDRVLPYLLTVVCDPLSPSVRRVAVDALTHVLSLVKEVSPSDNNVFIDYILPVLTKVAADKSSFVRATLAANLGTLAETASRFQQMMSAATASSPTNGAVTIPSATSLSIRDSEEEMVQMFQDMISHLLTDPSSDVKRTLLDSNISKLCVFLGRQKTNDVILSHIITFLNDKEDYELRASFFENIVPIASFLGGQSSSILRPLLQQGLSDADEFVIQKTLTSLTSLTELKFLDRTLLLDLMSESIPLLSHPNLWIRHAVVSFLITLSDELSLAESHCKVMPQIRKKLSHDIHLLSPDLMMEYLQPPIPREIYSMIVNRNNNPAIVEGLFDFMKEQKHLRTVQGNRHHVTTGNIQSAHPYGSLFQKLKDNGMTPEVEEQLIDLSDIMIRISKNSRIPQSMMPSHLQKKTHRRTGSGSSIKSDISSRPSDPSVITLETKNMQSKPKVHFFSLVEENKLVTTRIRSLTMNEDWKHMFGSRFMDTVPAQEETVPVLESYSDPAVVVPIASEAQEDSEPCPPCRRELKQLEVHKKDTHELCLWSRGIDLSSSATKSGTNLEVTTKSLTAGDRVYLTPTTAKPRGVLVAHLHEHLSSVNRLIPLADGSSCSSSMFASCSSDGFIKTWDAGKISHLNNDQSSPPSPIAKSSQSIASNDLSGFEGLTYCASMDNLIGVTSKSVLHVIKVDCGSSELRIVQTADLHKTEVGKDAEVTDIISCSPFALMTSYSTNTIASFDLRMGLTNPSFTMNIDMRDGFVTCITGTEYAVFAAASSGAIYMFDTRFLMRANMVRYDVSKRIRRLLFTPLGLFASVKGNNEVTLFDCETGFRLKTLWASRAPILSSNPQQSTPDSVVGMIYLSSPKDPNSSCLLTSGTDMRIRVWDLNSPEKSYVMSDGLSKNGYPIRSSRSSGSSSDGHQTFTYTSKIVDAIQVLAEEEHRPQPSASSPLYHPYVDPNYVSPAHHNTISDMSWMEKYGLLVSASKDGVIKIWK